MKIFLAQYNNTYTVDWNHTTAGIARTLPAVIRLPTMCGHPLIYRPRSWIQSDREKDNVQTLTHSIQTSLKKNRGIYLKPLLHLHRFWRRVRKWQQLIPEVITVYNWRTVNKLQKNGILLEFRQAGRDRDPHAANGAGEGVPIKTHHRKIAW